MKKILAAIYSVYVGLLFFICLTLMLIVYVPLLIIRNDRTRMKVIYIFNKIFLRWIWSTFTGLWVTVQDREKIKDDSVYVFVCNHSNMLDIPFTGSCIEHYYKPLVKKELLSFPVLGPLLRMTSLGVDRKSPESRRHSTQVILDKLKHGISLMIFPEGTRNKTGQPLKSFYGGAFKTAVLAQVPIQPFVYLDSRMLQPVQSYRFHPGTIRIRVLVAVETKGLTAADVDALQETVYKTMEEVILREDKDFKGRI